MKSYKINTLQDIIDCVTNENIDRFLIDFEGLSRSAILVKEATKHPVQTGAYEWIDDGKHNIDIEIQEI